MHYWHPTHCTLQLNFNRVSNSHESQSPLLTSGDIYTGTSVIRYVRRPLQTSSSSSSLTLSSLEKTMVSTGNEDGLHFHAITALSRTLPKAQPLVLHSIKVHTYPGETTSLKVIRVVEEDGDDVQSDEQSSKNVGKSNNHQRRGKGKEKKNNSKNESQGEDEKLLQTDPGSKRVFFEGGDSLPSGSTVTLTIAFTGRIQAWDQGGIYTNDKSESTTTGIGVSATQGVLLTHFEVSLARLAFPCPDDPQQYRLIWQLQSLQLPSLYSLVTSNTSEIMKKTMGNKGIQYSFAPIGPLPAYVLAFAAFSGSVEVVETTLHTRKPLSTLVEDNNKNNNNKCNTMGIRNYNNVETILPLRVITSKTSGVSLSMLNQIAYIAQEAVRLLEDFFAAPLPLQQLPFSENFEHQEEMLTIVVAPTMPYISGMEHHSCIFLNETIYRTSQNNNNNNNSSSGSGSSGNSNNNNNTKGSSKQQATSSDEVSRVELIVHELAHHWVGNALGMPFVLKEGVCLLLEQCFCDIIMGKPMRKIKPSGDTLSSTFITPAPSVSTTSSRTESSLTVSTATTVVDTEKGKEFTGYSYQKALNTLGDVVSRMGFSTFKERMQYMYFNEVMKHSENCGEEDYNSHFSVKDYLTPYVRADEFLAYMGT